MMAIRCFAVPFAGLEQIASRTPAITIKISEMKLSFGLALFGSFAQPEKSFGVVFCHCLAVKEFQAQSQLGLRNPLESCFLIPLSGFGSGLKDPASSLTHCG